MDWRFLGFITQDEHDESTRDAVLGRVPAMVSGMMIAAAGLQSVFHCGLVHIACQGLVGSQCPSRAKAEGSTTFCRKQTSFGGSVHQGWCALDACSQFCFFSPRGMVSRFFCLNYSLSPRQVID